MKISGIYQQRPYTWIKAWLKTKIPDLVDGPT